MTTAMKRGIHVPMLYKNFVIDEYQLFQARRCGAAAVLLIAACLTKEQCRSLISAAHSLKLEVLLELHSESELEYCDLDADVIGINNRNLGTFTTDIENSFRLAEQLPTDAVKVSESGIAKPESIRRLRQAGFKGFLIGETFMSTENPGQALKQFIARL
jgi:indole-3-glycerol phosphate synthase